MTKTERQPPSGFSEMIPVCYGLKLSSGTDITRFYLYPASTGLLYVLPYLDATTSGTVPVATLPDSTISQLKELANAQQQALDSGIAYDQFCSQIQQASAIQVTPPSRFSVSYPEPITAPSLLEAGPGRSALRPGSHTPGSPAPMERG